MNWKKNSKSLENQEAGKGNVDTEERREIAVLEADPGCGLGAEEVRLRVENGYVNRSDSSPTKSVGDIIKSNTFTFSTWYLLCWGLSDCSGVLYQPAFSCDCRCKYVYRDFSGGPFQKGCGQAHASGGAENTLYPGRGMGGNSIFGAGAGRYCGI